MQKPINVFSAIQSIEAFNQLDVKDEDLKKNFNLKIYESNTLNKLITELKALKDIKYKCFNGYYFSYKIKQISKEFDLLRIGKQSILNIELKSKFDLNKIEKQMKQNHYYLKFLNKKMHIYTYVENVGLYVFNFETKKPQKANIYDLKNVLEQQEVDFEANPSKLFIPSNYLISPFNKTEKFLNGEYFLTSQQEEIKNVILKTINKNKYKIFCISANAGTGKTLLTYDLVNELKEQSLIIHCGKLNHGHSELKNNQWNITSISRVNQNTVDEFIDKNSKKLIIIDEAQRISDNQLDCILEKSYKDELPLLFCYDTKQYMRSSENKNIKEYIDDFGKYYNIEIPVKDLKLTNKIRTNKEIAYFIKDFLTINNNESKYDYQNISIDYYDDFSIIKSQIKYLEEDGWKAINFSDSIYYKESIDKISRITYSNNSSVHEVIGQEFEKVVFVMDSNFYYNKNGKLASNANTYYNVEGMLYQIVTRVISELKIIVYNNPKLFVELLKIKNKK